MKNLKPLSEYNVNFDVSMVQDHLTTGALRDGISNSETENAEKTSYGAI
jgi:hypothetical protein